MKKKRYIIRNAETHPLTWRLRNDHQPIWLNEYLNKNGYNGAKYALNNMSSKEIITLVQNTGLKGRGGAGFPTGLKWNLIQNNNIHASSYLLCNADEMEPGSYKDRFLIEKIPHLLLEGMLIAAYAIKAYRGYIYIRCEYIEAAKNINIAIQEAKIAGFLGKNILNTNFNLDIFLHIGAGRYICGEETALINSLEGRRANPRAKPPFPGVSGIWGKPTCINNVETLCNIPAIIENGKEWYLNLNQGKSKDTGTKLMGFSGRVNNPGLWELPFGITAREILEDYANNMCHGLKLKAWLPGGASTDFLTERHLDVKMDFENMIKIGSRLGTALAIAVDNTINMVSLVLNLEKFFARESCGWCTPCRDGLPWSVKILQALELNEGIVGDIETLEHICYLLGPGKTFCAHAPGAIEPLQSAIKYFRDEFNSGIKNNNKLNNKSNNLISITGIQSNL